MKRSALRRELRRRRRRLPASQRERAGALVSHRLRSHPWFTRARHVALYRAFDGELPLTELSRLSQSSGKRLYLPRLAARGSMVFLKLGPERQLVRHRLGVLQPSRGARRDPRHLDLVLVPLVAFDASGTRLGMGGGHYDRCFSFLKRRRRWRRPKLLGVGYHFQLVSPLQRAAWDVPLHGAITDRECFFFNDDR